MKREEYEAFDGLGLAELVRRGEVSASELLDCASGAIEAENPRLNAVVDLFRDEAQSAIDRGLPAGPFRGVPFLLKDLGASVAGRRSSSGSRLFRDWIAPADAELVARHRRAGLVICGKTNLPELGLSFATDSALFGAARHPDHIQLGPGGSSGGAAAAVAAGWVPLAHGSDGAGSLRVPASCCGLFGLKPSRGLTPTGPFAGELIFGLAVEHGLSRSVRDSAALLDATCGEDAGAPYAAPRPERTFLEEVQRPPGRLRIALAADAPDGGPVDAACRRAAERAAALCAELGHDVEPVSWPSEWCVRATCASLISASVAHLLFGVCPAFGVVAEAGAVEASTWAFAERGRTMTAGELSSALARRDAVARSIGRFLTTFDVILTPTLASPPLPSGALRLDEPGITVDEVMLRLFAFSPFTAAFNVAGNPAMSVPLHTSADGLPIGVQFAARFGDDATLFRLAGQLEAAAPWARRQRG